MWESGQNLGWTRDWAKLTPLLSPDSNPARLRFRLSHLSTTSQRYRECARTQIFCVCSMPNRQSKLKCDIGATGEVNESPYGG